MTIAAATLLLFLMLTGQLQAQSALDGFDPNANGRIEIVAVQPDGKILVGGDFSTLSPNAGPAITRNNIARLNPDGTLDDTFNPNADCCVKAIAVQADGKILVIGGFTNIGGQPRNRIARLDATTGLADSFDPNANDFVGSIALQSDGKLLVGGSFTSIGGQQRNHIARLDATNGLADSFDPNANERIDSIAVQADGKILVGGIFTSIGGQSRNHLARVNATTGLADSFAPNPSDASAPIFVNAIVVQADGNILVGGQFSTISGHTRHSIARLKADGTVDTVFDPNADFIVFSITVQADGKILAGGFFNRIGGQTRNHIARLDANTGLADSFNPNITGASVSSIVAQADGKILAGGIFNALSPNGGATVTRNNIARLETDGRLDRTLDLNVVGSYVFATATQPDGKILIGGQFSSVLGVTRNNIARLNTDGTLDTAFNPNADFIVASIVVQPGGKILVGGYFSNIGGQPRGQIARLDAATGLADSFNAGAGSAGSYVLSLAVQEDGKILAGGAFSMLGGQMRRHIGRLDPVTGLADSFDPQANGIVEVITVQRDGKILVGGEFSGTNSIGGQTRNRLARFDAASGLADSFDPNANRNVNAFVEQPDGKILVGGYFSSTGSTAPTIGGEIRSFIARLDATTGLADFFDPSADGLVSSLAPQADGKILVGGNFRNIGGQMRSRIARLDDTTGLADSFDPNAVGDVFSTTVQSDGKILVGGGFTEIGGQTRSRFARLNNGTAAFQNLAASQSSITWTRGGSSPQLMRASFEFSNDNVNYTALGNGAPSGSNWSLTGLSLPIGQNFYIRAHGYYRSGYFNSSESITESVLNAFVSVTTLSPTASSPTTVGETISGVATLSGGASPVGTITFNVYGPDDATCGGTVAFTSTSNVNGNGTYTSAGFTPTAPGTYRFVAIYSGSAGNASSASGCNDANTSVVVSKKSPTITSNASATVALGGSVSDTATLAAGFNPSGTITFSLYGPNDSNCGAAAVFTSSVPVNAGNATYGSGNFTPSATGIYRWVASYGGDTNNNPVGGQCNDANAFVTVTKANPVISTQASPNVFLGGSISDAATLANGTGATGTVTFSLFGPDNETCAGTPLFTSTKTVNGNGNYSSGSFTPSSPGTYRFVAAYGGDANNNLAAGVCGDATEMVKVNPGLVGNVSTRLAVGTGDDALIEGFIVQGPTGSMKKIMVRALGPSLTGFGVADALANPTLEIHDASGSTVATNNDWRSTQQGQLITGDQSAEINSSGLAPGNDLESAIIANLAPGNFTAVVRGAGNTTGTGVVDAYDLNGSSPARLANIATRGLVQAGDKLMIAGFIVQSAPVKAVVRAIGPSLTAFGITNALADTTLQLRDQNGAIVRENDNWKTDQRAELESTGLQPTDDLEAALVETIQPGQYTAQVRGKNDSSGIGVVQVYFLQ
ncbi:MAG: hypothetical protein QOE26_1532 [Verrucomicrobiota bacterium]